MSGQLRVGGRAPLAGGVGLSWSVAEGSRGRRWRESLDRGGDLIRSLLLETDRNLRPTRLEMATASGLLTLHPDPSEVELHGNVVTASGIRHLRFDWGPDHELLVPGSPACASVTLGRLAGNLDTGGTRTVAMLRIDDALQPSPVAWQVTRIGPAAWSVRSVDGDEERSLSVGPDGLVVLRDTERWPLELE